MIGDTVYRFEQDDVDPNINIMLKIVQVSLDDVQLSQNDDGDITITERPKPQPAVQVEPEPKYRLQEADGGLYRPVLLRDIGSIRAGTVGGLVDSSRTLSQYGSCWIDYDAKVVGGAEVSGDARVMGGADFTGAVYISQDAVVSNSKITASMSGTVHIYGNANVSDSTVHAETQLVICGTATIHDSIVTAPRRGLRWDRLHLTGCCIREADVANEYEVLSFQTQPWGWLSAYRGKDGELQISVGCQNHGGFDAIRNLALDNSMRQVDMEMLEAFFVMVRAAQSNWRPVPQPKVELPPNTDFRGMAERARDAVHSLNAPRPTLDTADMVRPAVPAADEVRGPDNPIMY